MPVEIRDTDVCIIGAGPAGLTTAMELGSRGHDVTIIEFRNIDEFSSPKSNHISARSMEIFRRLGVADDIRSQGMPDDYPNDCVYSTRFTGHELTRFRVPCRSKRFDDAEYDDGNLPSVERGARVSQMYLAPVLLRHALRFPKIRMLNSTKFEALEEDDSGVTVTCRERDSGDIVTIRCRYLVGADGARSDVRRALSIALQGEGVLLKARSVLFRAPDLIEKCAYPAAWMHNFFVRGQWSSFMVTLDGKGLWLFHHFIPGDMEFEDFDLDKGMRECLDLEPDFQYEVLGREDWVGRRLVAERLQVGRSFIVGDAAHLWLPYGGFGMNAGIVDGSTLAWMLDAVLSGWAPEAMLAAYEAERLPVVEKISRFAAGFAEEMRYRVGPEVEHDTPEGEKIRKDFGEHIWKANRASMVPTGLNFGYCYENSPVIAYDGEQAPPFTMGEYTPSTVPGCRLPHFWQRDGRSVYDALGSGFTLLRFDKDSDTSALEAAARRRKVPLDVLDADPGKGFDAAVYPRSLVLVRPDQYIAWRGDAPPEDADALIDLIRCGG